MSNIFSVKPVQSSGVLFIKISASSPTMGGTEHLTPTEARELITMLTAAIAEAEKQKTNLKTNKMKTKEQRTEHVCLTVTASVKKELEAAENNDTLKEEIIRRFLRTETEWLSDELKGIEESTVKYSAKLIGIKDAFSKCQDAYVEEIEAIQKRANDTFSKINAVSENTRKGIETTKSSLVSMLTQINEINFHKIERLLELINRVNSMSTNELELMKKMLGV